MEAVTSMGLSWTPDDTRVPGQWEGGGGDEETRGGRVTRSKIIGMNIICQLYFN